MAAPDLPIDVWRLIMERLAQTDLLRSADIAARDIAAAACACRSSNEAAETGWRALRPADPTRWSLRGLNCREDEVRRWRNHARRFQQGHMSEGDMTRMVKECSRLYRGCIVDIQAIHGPAAAFARYIDRTYHGSSHMRLRYCRQTLNRLMPLRSRNCPQIAVLLAVTDRHMTVLPADAMRRYCLTKEDLTGIEGHNQVAYKLSDIRQLVYRKWTDMAGLQGALLRLKWLCTRF